MRSDREMRTPRAQGWVAALWVWPTVSGAAALVLGTVLVRLDVTGTWFAGIAWPGDGDAASTLVQIVAGSVISVTTLTFSLTVVALQLASQQFSPRLLREFSRDPFTKASLCVLVATFVLAITVLRQMRADTPPPHVAVLAVFIMGLTSLAAVLFFITHLIRILRVESMMLTVHGEAVTAIEMFYPDYGDPRPRPPGPTTTPEGRGGVVRATRSGFVRLIDVEALVARARDQDAVVDVLARPGDHVMRGTPIAEVWSREGGLPEDMDGVETLVQEAIAMGYERTMEQDAAYGFRELEDIAVKALSPGINDPVTAAHAIGHMGDLLSRLVGCRLGPTVHEDENGVGRAIVRDRDLPYYLALSCGQIRRYGSAEPTVLVALLRMLRDVGASARDDEQREQIAREARLVVDAAAPSLLPAERRSVEEMEEQVRTSLYGDIVMAYRDRAGETRSI
jgi:uncharacterized membrane protein